jgi:hypothetical protein
MDGNWNGIGEMIYPHNVSYYGSWKNWDKSGLGI